MKKALLIFVLIVASYFAHAQTNTFPSSGNVGIGTTAPLTLFDVKLATNQHIQFGGDVNGNYLGSPGIVAINDANTAYTPIGFFATNYFFGGGNVGIGTTTANSRLQVSGTISAIDLPSTLGSSTPVIYGSIGNAYSSWGVSINHVVENAGTDIYGMALYTTNSYLTGRTEKMRITGTGNVGIGTTTPTAIFHVVTGNNTFKFNNGASNTTPNISVGTSGGKSVALVAGTSGTASVFDNTGSFMISGDSKTNIDGGTTSGGTPYLTVTGTGNVAIGTSDPKGYLFAVNGSAIATSMTVKLNTNWPDYVFKPAYRLPLLSEVKTYIDQNQHLPDMPSEAEIAKDGLNLGEINKVLTKKVEELTLYLIEQEKIQKEQQEQISELKESMKQFLKR